MAEDEIIKKHTKAVYKAWKNPDSNWTRKLKEILLEISIIVFAVSFSIWLHSRAEDSKDRRQETDFFYGLKDDLQADLKEMAIDREGYKMRVTGIHYFEKVGAGEPLTNDSLKKYQFIFFSETQINPRIGRFEALKGSGKLDIIENKKLLYNIIDLYQKDFPQISRLNNYFYSLVVDKIDPFIGDNLQLDKTGSISNAQILLRTPKMRFWLQNLEWAQNITEAYTNGINKSNEILNQIDKESK